MNPRIGLCIVVPVMLTLCSGCCGLFVHPNVAQVQQWAVKELPPGSTVTDVKQFCARRGFEYHEPPASNGPRCVFAVRLIDACMWLYGTFIQMNANLDESGKVKSVEVHRVEWWL